MKKIPKETTAKFHRYENVKVKNRSTVGASAKIYNFPTDREEVTLALPPDLAKQAKSGAVDIVTLEGDSLEGIGLFDGDRVICKLAVNRSQIKPKDICIVYIKELNDAFAKKVVFDGNNVILRSFNPDILDMMFHKDEVEIQGIVQELLTRADVDGTFFRTPRPPRISRAERKQRVAAAIKTMTKPVVEEEFEF